MNWLALIIAFGAGLLLGAIMMTILLVFVIKEGQEFGFGHHIHHHGDEHEDDS